MDSCLLFIDMKTQSNKVLNSNKIGILRCGKRTNQAVLLEVPVVLPRSFLMHGLLPANHRRENTINKILNSNKVGILRCGEQTNQVVLLEGPLVLPRSFLVLSDLSGILKK